ncbi:hypothetical protein Tsubulata_050184, partial [Turnera subulata]
MNMKLNHIYAMECIDCICREIPAMDVSQFSKHTVGITLLTAVQNGIEEIVIQIFKACPDINAVDVADNQGRDLIITYGKVNIQDYDGNNMLHWAGMPPPPEQLARISGAALQMQRELQWFKAVESIVQQSFSEFVNKLGDTPRQGNFQDSGFPIFGRKKAFIIFIVSDAIALFSSSTSVLMFLGILTSRYTEDDFLISLPRKLIIGLSTLFVSIAAMM